MRTVGQLLKEARLKKGSNYDEVEKATKIRARYIQAIEEDNFKKLPAAPYIQGFIKNYSDYLGLRTHTVLALFRREFIEKNKRDQVLIEEPLTVSGWKLTPNKVIFTLIIILTISLFAYFYRQYQILHEPPPLLIESPTQDFVTQDEMLPVYGTTDTDAIVVINNEPVLVKDDGKFYKDLLLSIGGNTVTIEATSRAEEKTTITRKVTRIVQEGSNE